MCDWWLVVSKRPPYPVNGGRLVEKIVNEVLVKTVVRDIDVAHTLDSIYITVANLEIENLKEAYFKLSRGAKMLFIGTSSYPLFCSRCCQLLGVFLL